MVRLTLEQRIKVIELYFKNDDSLVLTRRAFCRHFDIRNGPSDSTILRLVIKFRDTGSVHDLGRPGRPQSIRTEEAVERVQTSVEEDQQTSIRRRSSELHIAKSSLHRILKADLGLFPYKVQVAHALQPDDCQRRLEYAVRLQEFARANPIFIHQLIMSDEAHFHLNGYVNKQNCRFWGESNPHELVQRQLHPKRCTIWCGVTSQNIIGPFFFESGDGAAVTISGERYRDMIDNMLRPALQNRAEMWFQQDGATAHTARATLNLLQQLFGDRIISKGSQFAWPPRSPDLSAPDFFLWGYLKERVYRNKPRSIEELKENIRNEIAALGPEILEKVMDNAIARARLCKDEQGGHLKDVIFKL